MVGRVNTRRRDFGRKGMGGRGKRIKGIGWEYLIDDNSSFDFYFLFRFATLSVPLQK